MLKLVGGLLAILFGGATLLFVLYKLLVERDVVGKPVGGLIFGVVMLSVGGKWVLDGWGQMSEGFTASRPKKSAVKKKKTQRPALEEADE